MKAYLIDANRKTVSPVELADGLAGIRRLIGYDSVDSEEIDASGDRLFFDEGCFLRDQTGKGRFKLDSLVPVADKAVVAGSGDDGATLKDVAADLAALQQRIAWL
ncbi:hypothetical protein [Thiobacillus sp. 65-1402]|uniref:hypothetical protein n=1 Tax=Thiobacillus sp. 65-1402 TaxID=1895861 RepID=UPI00092CC867|nr:hypothetical protein [Thiobacillus sp. 65-1402]OJW58765.1 MAG: hypothetical protein BGO60_09115 [Thiobacillus sp. 65-1059]OJW83899.1 MAG: hypothetical protein BGO62_08205 [Thiobacillus sp. 65-1402]